MDLRAVGYRLKRSRLGDLLDTLYLTQTTRELFKAIEYALSSGVLTISVSDHDVRYPVDSKAEFGILRHLAVTERPVLEDFGDELRATDTVYDIGAHLGLYTLLAGQIVRTGDIVAFELARANANRLEQMASEHIIVIGRAVSDESGVRYDTFTEISPGSETASIQKIENGETATAETITIDEIAPEQGQPNVVKIDVEGHELAVLTGGSRTFSDEQCRVIYLEMHDVDDREEVVRHLRRFGFNTVRTIHTREDQNFLKATR